LQFFGDARRFFLALKVAALARFDQRRALAGRKKDANSELGHQLMEHCG
jgi:hypothetical protein